MRRLHADDLDAVRFTVQGGGPRLVPVIAQDATTGSVLMMAWADVEALSRSFDTGEMHYWSRSRSRLWKKGETSGHVQTVRGLFLDCDGDTVLALVDQEGPACHTDATTCWHREGDAEPHTSGIVGELLGVLRDRKRHPKEGSHTNRLLDDENLRLKKVGEEAGEFQMAAARGDRDEMVQEAADVLYHLLVALEGAGVPAERVLETLARRRR